MTIAITDRQMRAIVHPARVLGIKGCAGSGKSMVAILRAVRQHMLDEGRVLILAYNRPLISYLKGLARADDYEYPELQLSLDDSSVPLPADLSEFDIADVVTTVNYDRFGMGLLGNLKVVSTDRGRERRMLEQVIDAADVKDKVQATKLRMQVERAGIVGANNPTEAREMRASFARMSSDNLDRVFEVRNAWLAAVRADGLVGGWDEIPLVLRGMIEDQALSPGRYRYRHIVLDEAQDFTPAWLRLIKDHLVEPGGTLTVVGDAAQTLYPRLGRVARFPYQELGLPGSGEGPGGQRVVSLADRSHRLAANPGAQRLARWWFDRYIASGVGDESRNRPGDDDVNGTVAYTTFESHDDELGAESAGVLQQAQKLLATGSVAIMLPAAATRANLSSIWRDAIGSTGATVRVLKEETRSSADAVTFWGEGSRSHIWFVSYRLAKGAEWDYVIVPRLSDCMFYKGIDGFSSLKNEVTESATESASFILRRPTMPVLKQSLYVVFTRARKQLLLSCPFQHSELFAGAPVARP